MKSKENVNKSPASTTSLPKVSWNQMRRSYLQHILDEHQRSCSKNVVWYAIPACRKEWERHLQAFLVFIQNRTNYSFKTIDESDDYQCKQKLHNHKVQASRYYATLTLQKLKDKIRILLFHMNSMDGTYLDMEQKEQHHLFFN